MTRPDNMSTTALRARAGSLMGSRAAERELAKREADIRLADCPACDGYGAQVHGCITYEPGCGYAHSDTYETPCEECGGRGQVLREVEPAGLEDTTGVLLPEDGKHPHHWPFEPTGVKP